MRRNMNAYEYYVRKLLELIFFLYIFLLNVKTWFTKTECLGRENTTTKQEIFIEHYSLFFFSIKASLVN